MKTDSFLTWISIFATQAGSRIQAVITLLAEAGSGTRVICSRVLKEGLKDIERIESWSRERMAALQAIISQADPSELIARLARDRILMDAIQKEFAAMRAEEGRAIPIVAVECRTARR